MKPKYKTLAELSKAFQSGELDDSYYLMVDKGGSYLSLSQNGDEEGEDDRFEHCRELFDREYGCPVEELLELIGIPSEEA